MKKLYLVFPESLGTIKPELYGHFAEHIGGVIYDGIWVGKESPVPNIHGFRKFLVEKFKAINPPVLRWPGGCYAETYDWRDGIGKNRPMRRSWWTSHDGRMEPNQVGTHEFVDFCKLVDTAPYFAANLTSVSPLHMRDWIDYCSAPQGSTTLAQEREENGSPQPFDIPYWGIGNENWGGGGNMTPETYAHEYRKYAELAYNTKPEGVFIACGPNDRNYDWTQRCMEIMAGSTKHMHGFSLHYYCGNAGDPVAFTRDEWFQQLAQAAEMEPILQRHWSIIQGYNMEQHAQLVIDEWGCWHKDGSGPSKGYNLFEQQSTMRDALVTAMTLNIFNNHCDKIMMANVAQLVNNLHCLFLSSGEHCILTPTYHVFDMYKEHQGATAIRALAAADSLAYTDKDGRAASIADLSVSASEKDGYTTVTIANLSLDNDQELQLEALGGRWVGDAALTTLVHADCHAHNTFEAPDNVTTTTSILTQGSIIPVPRAGIVSLRFRRG